MEEMMQRNRYEMLTDENLIEELRGGDSAITDFIMNKYKPMVRKKARAMFLLGGENEDLIQEGMIGLFKAIRDYETRQGTSFASFAELCVSRQMYSAIEASQRKKHLPLNSYVSLYEESVEEGKKVPLIDTIEPQEENNPEALYFGKEFTEIFSERLFCFTLFHTSHFLYHLRQLIVKLSALFLKFSDITEHRIRKVDLIHFTSKHLFVISLYDSSRNSHYGTIRWHLFQHNRTGSDF